MASQEQSIRKTSDSSHSSEDSDNEVCAILNRISLTERISPEHLNNYETGTGTEYSGRIIFSPKTTTPASDDDSDNGENVRDFDTGELLESIRQAYEPDITEGLSKYHTRTPHDRDILYDIDESIKRIPQETHANEHVTSCANCCKPKRVENVSCFEKGQHIRLPGERLTFNFGRKLIKAYNHHAIVKNVISASGNAVKLELIHFAKEEGKIKITEEIKVFNLENDEIHIIDYERPRYDQEIIVQRAESMVPKDTTSKEFRSYNLVVCNCEHFASWCVLGEGESFQIKGCLKSLKKGFITIADVGCKIWRFVKRFLDNASDEMAAIDLGQLCPALVLGASGLLYLFYTIGMTIYYRLKYMKRKLCEICTKRNIISLWISIGAFVGTSVVPYLMVHFLLPSIANPLLAISLLIVIVVLSLILRWSISKVVKALKSPYACDEIEIKDTSQIIPGSMISFSYFGIRHNAIVTGKYVESVEEQICFMRYVHYGRVGRRREVMEEGFELNVKRNIKNVKLVDCRQLQILPPNITVERVRERIGETKWRPFSNRSEHLCFYSMVQEKSGKEKHNTQLTFTSKSTSNRRKSTFYTGKQEIHLKGDLQVGEIVTYDGNTGLIVALEDINGEGAQRFKMELMVYSQFWAMRKKVSVNLKKKRLFVQKYHPAHCCPLKERVKNALEKEYKKCEFWTENGFLRSCILKNLQVKCWYAANLGAGDDEVSSLCNI